MTHYTELPAAIAASPIWINLDGIMVLKPRETISGMIRGTWNPAYCDGLNQRLKDEPTNCAFEICIHSLQDRDRIWSTKIPISVIAPETEYTFSIPIRELSKGPHQLLVLVSSENGVRYRVPIFWATTNVLMDTVDFCLADICSPPTKPAVRHTKPLKYLPYVIETIHRLRESQSARLGGTPKGTLFLTVTGNSGLGYLSLGFKKGGRGRHYERPYEHRPVLADLAIWRVLENLTDLSGSKEYRQWVEQMATAFAVHGFHPRSGLGYVGYACKLDVEKLRPVGTSYKPGPDVPLDRLWEQAPVQMRRMIKSMYLAMVTRPDTMDYNRHGPYEFDDQERKPAMPFMPGHLPFIESAGHQIHWWGTHFARTGDPETFEWARRMVEKWRPMQDSVSGLVPYYYYPAGTLSEQMAPEEFSSPQSTSSAAVALFHAASEFAKRPEGLAFANELRTMAGRMAHGVAKFAYDKSRRIFHSFLKLDGSPYQESARYTFRTQTEKDAAVKRDPSLNDAVVFDGKGFFVPADFSLHTAGCEIPWQLAWCAKTGRDPDLVARLKPMAEIIVEESLRTTRPLTSEYKWTFPASGLYIRTLVVLFELTGERVYLDWAGSMADAEIEHLDQVRYPEWWRMPDRHKFLQALLDLHSAMETSGAKFKP